MHKDNFYQKRENAHCILIITSNCVRDHGVWCKSFKFSLEILGNNKLKQRSTKIYVVLHFIHACSTQYTFEFEIQRIKYHGNCKLSEDGTCIKLKVKQDRVF